VSAGCVALLVTVAHAAAAATVHVSPTRVVLQPNATSTTIAIRNDGREPTRFRASGYRWVATDGLALRIEPTDSLVVFPSLFVLGPGEQRVIRIGTRETAAAVERSYRLVLDELPDHSGPAGVEGVQMLTRLNLPVFVAPPVRRLDATLDASLEGSASGSTGLQVSLTNGGTVHVTTKRFAVRGLRPDGSTAWTRDLTPWYLLATERRLETVHLTSSECATATSLVAEVELEEMPGRPLREHLASGRMPCEP
jgi:fimbrial chaperone protein